MEFHRNGPSFLRKSSTKLVSGTSGTFDTIARRLRPLEAAPFVIITEAEGHVVVELPRYRLSFYLDVDGQLQSRTHPGFVVDENQSAGVLFGLDNQLILRPVDIGRSAHPRRVLIPAGSISFAYQSTFTKVTVDTSGEPNVRYHAFDIDTTLGRLVGNGTLYGRLYQALLHALTSYCLPDPLTSRTGVEVALELLALAGCASF